MSVETARLIVEEYNTIGELNLDQKQKEIRDKAVSVLSDNYKTKYKWY